MSQDEALSRKDKKAQRDADRRKRGKKRKHDETGESTKSVEQNESERDFVPLDSGVAVVSEQDRTSLKTSAKKRKVAETVEEAKTSQHNGEAHTAAKPSKKRKKTNDNATNSEAIGTTPTSSDKAHRFILFVGNLPYGATDVSIRAHFKKLEPFTVRHRTDPKTGKSKGFAFLEFENYDRMKTCLKLYHHSMFDPDKTETDAVDGADAGGAVNVTKKPNAKSAKAGKSVRRINVELTAGGGGKAEGRKEKIRVKNERLGQQRQRRAEAELKEKEKKATKEGEGGKTVKKTPKQPETNSGETMSDVHPSRLARIAG